MEKNYATEYRHLYQEHWWWRAREGWLVDWLRRERPEGGFGRILDIGCGDALFFDRLKEFGELFGIEPDAHTLSGNSPWQERIHAGSLESFESPEPFGLVIMLDVLEHVEEPAAFLRRALGLLAPGGRVLITVPALMALWTRHDDLNRHFIRYDKASFGKVAGAAGLKIEQCRYFFHWLVAAKLLVRLHEHLQPGEPAPPAVPAGPVNRMLYGLSRFEQLSIGRVFPLPFGSSLFVVGKHQ